MARCVGFGRIARRWRDNQPGGSLGAALGLDLPIPVRFCGRDGLKTFENVLNRGLRLLRCPRCGFGRAKRGASVIGQHLAVAGGMGIPLGYPRGGLRGSAGGARAAFWGVPVLPAGALLLRNERRRAGSLPAFHAGKRVCRIGLMCSRLLDPPVAAGPASKPAPRKSSAGSERNRDNADVALEPRKVFAEIGGLDP